ncbi:Heat shock protein HSP 90-beta [Cladochytrium tenue]|nr:Heat shock protein HSP 90-beta [Cladochytrium tenue]
MAVFFPRDSVFGDIDRLFDAFASDVLAPPASSSNNTGTGTVTRARGGGALGRLDLAETDSSYVIHADLPGVAKENVSVSVGEGNVLTIAGERQQNSETKDARRHIVERSYGRFERAVRLPEDADVDKVQAKMNEGVLELSFPKLPPLENRNRTITIQ